MLTIAHRKAVDRVRSAQASTDREDTYGSRNQERTYDETAETSFYVKDECRGQGIGRQLKLAIIDEAKRLGFHSLIARVAEGSGESLHINESVGFTRVGILKEVGRKFGQRLGVHILQKMLD